jgi:hypothetical protein
MSNIIVAKIHNQSLGKCVFVDTVEDGKNVIRDWFFEQFDRVINADEIDTLENQLEVYNDEDSDNNFTFSIGIIEDDRFY